MQFSPRDFHNLQVMQNRMIETEQLARYMLSQGLSIEFWENVKAGKQDPWEKLAHNDVNSQMVQFANPHTHFTKKDTDQKQVNNA
jgi:hypothetical protein